MNEKKLKEKIDHRVRCRDESPELTDTEYWFEFIRDAIIQEREDIDHVMQQVNPFRTSSNTAGFLAIMPLRDGWPEWERTWFNGHTYRKALGAAYSALQKKRLLGSQIEERREEINGA
jgi:hypothetical protein